MNPGLFTFLNKNPMKYGLFFLVVLLVSTSFTNPEANADTYVIVIDKSENTLQVFEDDECLVTYPVVFGTWDKSDKLMQGDKRTPEGSYRIIHKKPHNKWSKFMLIDYPNKEDQEKFEQRKRAGIIPSHAKIGGNIGIHGTWPREDFAIDYKQQWTEGCISTKNKFVDKLYSVVPNGTRVVIQP